MSKPIIETDLILKKKVDRIVRDYDEYDLTPDDLFCIATSVLDAVIEWTEETEPGATGSIDTLTEATLELTAVSITDEEGVDVSPAALLDMAKDFEKIEAEAGPIREARKLQKLIIFGIASNLDRARYLSLHELIIREKFLKVDREAAIALLKWIQANSGDQFPELKGLNDWADFNLKDATEEFIDRLMKFGKEI
ncbi:hypothetical protein LCGC14_1019820 [marine sediment metagenome]|uniref:Uncharacterized protein n=1 Tax=marine sediment metagenome TaxID=412755 RepID=A0A0F9QFY4_9ZZZZ